MDNQINRERTPPNSNIYFPIISYTILNIRYYYYYYLFLLIFSIGYTFIPLPGIQQLNVLNFVTN
jgi:hypothetical protein